MFTAYLQWWDRHVWLAVLILAGAVLFAVLQVFMERRR